MLSAVLDAPLPQTVEEKRKLLLTNNIALWDVIASCDIDGSSDSSIRNVTVNDVFGIVSQSRVERILLNGRTAERFFKKHIGKSSGVEVLTLPSTSPANAATSLETLISVWRKAIIG